MNIALCAPYMEADLIAEQIRANLPKETIQVDEYYKIDDLLPLPGPFFYDAVWVALPGALGMEAVLAMRQESPRTPVVWISEDREFGMNSHKLNIAMFLLPDSPPEDFHIAMQNIRKIREGSHCLW